MKLAVKHAEQKNTVKTSVSAITKRRKSVRKRVQKLKNPPPGQATCGTAKKDVANQKIEVKKLKNTGFFFTFRLPILDGRVHEQVSSVLFFTVFFEGEHHDLSKTGGFGRKMPPPPPGKPVTFYECHPEDHAPAPSVRADFLIFYLFFYLAYFLAFYLAIGVQRCLLSLRSSGAH